MQNLPFNAFHVWLKVLLEKQWDKSLHSSQREMEKERRGAPRKNSHSSMSPAFLQNPHVSRLLDVQFSREVLSKSAFFLN